MLYQSFRVVSPCFFCSVTARAAAVVSARGAALVGERGVAAWRVHGSENLVQVAGTLRSTTGADDNANVVATNVQFDF